MYVLTLIALTVGNPNNHNDKKYFPWLKTLLLIVQVLNTMFEVPLRNLMSFHTCIRNMVLHKTKLKLWDIATAKMLFCCPGECKK